MELILVNSDVNGQMNRACFYDEAKVCNTREVCIYHNAYKGKYPERCTNYQPAPVLADEPRLHFILEFGFYGLPENTAMFLALEIARRMGDDSMIYCLHRQECNIGGGCISYAYHMHLFPRCLDEEEEGEFDAADLFMEKMHYVLAQLGFRLPIYY